MNILRFSFSRLRGGTPLTSIAKPNLPVSGTSQLRLLSNWVLSRITPGPQISKCGLVVSQAEGSRVFQQLPWQYQPVRTKKRGMEYQPKNLKRKRTHGWIKRIRTKSGIEVILRRMLKGRNSLTH
ncbi:39S ribosomal protein L34, mitochondrial [Lampris incognitus]|uniref:39S ribosomal protein L34, mitochondrial n=1 Tax=Lampris incognitus TaxID=2546036 RepID=UPI0024B48CCF|nr:39S ribosomal protein L34, mitochondrial [Lampris incognitus]